MLWSSLYYEVDYLLDTTKFANRRKMPKVIFLDYLSVLAKENFVCVCNNQLQYDTKKIVTHINELDSPRVTSVLMKNAWCQQNEQSKLSTLWRVTDKRPNSWQTSMLSLFTFVFHFCYRTNPLLLYILTQSIQLK